MWNRVTSTGKWRMLLMKKNEGIHLKNHVNWKVHLSKESNKRKTSELLYCKKELIKKNVNVKKNWYPFKITKAFAVVLVGCTLLERPQDRLFRKRYLWNYRHVHLSVNLVLLTASLCGCVKDLLFFIDIL